MQEAIEPSGAGAGRSRDIGGTNRYQTSNAEWLILQERTALLHLTILASVDAWLMYLGPVARVARPNQGT